MEFPNHLKKLIEQYREIYPFVVFVDLHEEMFAWCQSNFGPRDALIFHGEDDVGNWNSFVIDIQKMRWAYCFKKEKDAANFKMTWC